MDVGIHFNQDIKDVAVIGAGPGGAAVTKALLAENHFNKIKMFEKRSKFGGLWNYTESFDNFHPIPCEDPLSYDPLPAEPKTPYDKAHYSGDDYIYPTPAYYYLDTNVPSAIMAYNGYPFAKDLPIFPLRKDVLDYLVNYSKEISEYVLFKTKVVDIRLVFNENNGTSAYKWRVTSRPVSKKTNGALIESAASDTIELFDAVVVASGNYDIPYVPNRPGLKEWNEKFPGSIIHSKSYKKPQDYKSKNTLIIGNSASGADLAFQIVTINNCTVWKSKRSETALPAGKDDRIVDVPDVEKFDYENKKIFFVDGSSLDNIDKVIFCTGYLRSIPYLNSLSDTKTYKHPLITDGLKIHGLYRQLLSYRFPALAIIGIPRNVLPTRLSETQGTWLARVWSGRIKLPDVQTMENEESETIRQRGNGTGFHDLRYPEDVKYYHLLNKEIVQLGMDYGLFPVIWDNDQIKLRSHINELKEAFIAYKKETGISATTVKELQDAGLFTYNYDKIYQLEELPHKNVI
ncbi:FAD/NAD(P)-binding domain-containing protein [Ascoidea rubescens DSM 1968]|uniref:FAD/NAD(P)-binding domain-containing protein n=1 Tax=Ascoidea rubescens DSM 1968 TaxID=1344418 RepID=A0A1D2VIX9_9ASCO|nr:FAD/NAD(P)-binding domain-containing protein [Ascoidea rubescens DSM 1968]ODV61581.1 FAD/NAD(P)-binding domain-containing protein [Ascoidea rubescens DSM 1968]